MAPLIGLHRRVALHDTGSLARAAQVLNVTPSTLSHQIKFLEECYGSPLFVRRSTPLKFSALGQRWIELSAQVLPAVEQAERDLIRLSHGGTGTLRIAVECPTCFDWLMPAMNVFRQRWPEVELDIVSGVHPDPVSLQRWSSWVNPTRQTPWSTTSCFATRC